MTSEEKAVAVERFTEEECAQIGKLPLGLGLKVYRMCAATPPNPEDKAAVEREEVARLIDPEAFVPMEDIIGMRKAYVKADAILALLRGGSKADELTAWQMDRASACCRMGLDAANLSTAKAMTQAALDFLTGTNLVDEAAETYARLSPNPQEVG